MKYTTVKGKVILSPAQEVAVQKWCKVLHAEWNACVAAFQKASIIKQQKRWKKKALEALLSDVKGKEKSKLKASIEENLSEGEYPLHEWVWAPLSKPGKDGKIENAFHLSCRLNKAPGIKAIHELRKKGSGQNNLVEFYRYEHDLLSPYVCKLPPRAEEAKPKYDKIAKKIREEHPEGSLLNTRYENGLVKRFKASVTLYFQTFSSRGKPPKFKSFRDPLQWLFTEQSDQCSWTSDGISLPGKKVLGLLKDQNGNLRKRLKGYEDPDIRSASLSKEHDGWYLSLTIGYEGVDKIASEPSLERCVGIDMGVVHHITTSDGQMIGSREKLPKRLSFLEKKVERLQVKASRQVRFSKGWHHTQNQIRKARAEIARNRKAWAEHIITYLLDRYDFIAVEDLSLNAMKGKSKAKVDDKGKWTQNKAKAKAGLNRSLASAAPGRTLAMLERKAEGIPNKVVVRVNPKQTSQTCSNCGVVDKESRETQAKFVCKSCGFEINADINAAKNILSRGLAVF